MCLQRSFLYTIEETDAFSEHGVEECSARNQTNQTNHSRPYVFFKLNYFIPATTPLGFCNTKKSSSSHYFKSYGLHFFTVLESELVIGYFLQRKSIAKHLTVLLSIGGKTEASIFLRQCIASPSFPPYNSLQPLYR